MIIRLIQFTLLNIGPMVILQNNQTKKIKNMKQFLSILFLFVSLATSGQTYTKELEKSAKEGDIYSQAIVGYCYLNGAGVKSNDKKAYKWLSSASKGGNGEAMYNLAIMYELCRVKDGNPDEAWGWYERAADRGNVNAQMKLAYNFKEQNNLPEAEKRFSQAAKYGHNADAQYEYAKILLEKGNESESKTWFKKAANQGHKLAQKQYDKIDQKEREIAAAREAARRDSIARAEAEQRRLQAIEKRRQDSIDVATGRKLPTISMLTENCVERNDITTKLSHVDPVVFVDKETNASMWYRFSNLCKNDQLQFFGKNKLDDLDKALYKKSTEYQLDKAEFEAKRNGTFAVVIDLWSSAMDFYPDGFTIYPFLYPRKNPINSYYLRLPNFWFPVRPQTTVEISKKYTSYKLYKFTCSDVEKLQQIRSSASDMGLLLLFKPFMNGTDNFDDVSIATPIGLYLVNRSTGETVLNLSHHIRKSTIQEEKNLLARGVRFEKAEEERNKPKKHSTPKQIRCGYCGGKGYIEYFPIGSATLTRTRCTQCYGKGYKMEYYY